MQSSILFSGIQPTGTPHIGNYLGALKQWVSLQDHHESLYCIVDLHALTTVRDPEKLKSDAFESVRDLLALGLDPLKATIFIQSHVPEHLELAWIFSTLTPVSELERMTQYKDKSIKTNNTGLLTYPILMAADILLYHATTVPVGEDQMQHLELARIIARKFNNQYGTYFSEPQAISTEAKRIMSLSEPNKKMSKSHGSNHYIALTDSADTIKDKIKKAVTDTGDNQEGEMSPGVANLFALLTYFDNTEDYAVLMEAYTNNSLKYSDLKTKVADTIIKNLEPIQAKRQSISDSDVQSVITQGAKQARAKAHATMQAVREKVGLTNV